MHMCTRTKLIERETVMLESCDKTDHNASCEEDWYRKAVPERRAIPELPVSILTKLHRSVGKESQFVVYCSLLAIRCLCCVTQTSSLSIWLTMRDTASCSEESTSTLSDIQVKKI